MAAAAIAPFIPNMQVNLLFHGMFGDNFQQIPPNIQLVTFMEVGQIMSYESAEALSFWLYNSSDTTILKDLRHINSVKFKLNDTAASSSTIRTRVYSPGQEYPNFTLRYGGPELPILGIYDTDKAVFKIHPLSSEGRNDILTNAFLAVHHIAEENTFNLHTILTFLSNHAVHYGITIRVYLLACSQVQPGIQPIIQNMNENAPAEGWPSFENIIHEGGRRRYTRRRTTRKSRRRRNLKRRQHPKK